MARPGPKPTPTIPARFTPRFWEDVDGRSSIHKALVQRHAQLLADTGANSKQKQDLCQRAVFLSCWLETQEINASEGIAPLDLGRYTQAVNSLLGLYKALGLERHQVDTLTLGKYISERDK